MENLLFLLMCVAMKLDLSSQLGDKEIDSFSCVHRTQRCTFLVYIRSSGRTRRAELEIFEDKRPLKD